MEIDWNGVWAWDFWRWPLWEPLRNWLIAIGGFIALLFAARTYAMNSRAKREEQARKVYTRTYASQVLSSGELVTQMQSFSSAGVQAAEPDASRVDAHFRLLLDHTTHHVEVVNKSAEVIGPIRLRVSLENTPLGPISVTEWLDIGEPDGDCEMEFLLPEHEWSQESLKVHLLFRDSSGRWWKRVDAHPISRRWFDKLCPPKRK